MCTYLYYVYTPSSTHAHAAMTGYNITSYTYNILFLYCVHTALLFYRWCIIHYISVQYTPSDFSLFPRIVFVDIGPVRDRFWAPNANLKRTTLSTIPTVYIYIAAHTLVHYTHIHLVAGVYTIYDLPCTPRGG